MQLNSLISKIKASGLSGRGGAGFPAWQKWQQVKEASSDMKYVVCNAAESEPNVFKDRYLLEHHLKEVAGGIKLAIAFLAPSEGFIYLNHSYYQQFADSLKQCIGSLPIALFEKKGGYLAGEETTLLNCIEGKPLEPRLKPPYPAQSGLWEKPTLIHNVETFYWIFKISQDEYRPNRFYSIDGEVKNKGVFERPLDYTIEQLLRETDNWPSFDFFVQVGGGSSGYILPSAELKQPLKGTGSVVVYNRETVKPLDLMKKWAEFFAQENCDQCVPCREGLFRIQEMLNKGQINPEAFQDIFNAMEKTSLCPFGRMAATPFKTIIDKIL